MRKLMQECVANTQKNICKELTKLNEKECKAYPWQGQDIKGEGLVNLFQGGRFLEKGGVNVSIVEGPVFGNMLQMLSLDGNIDHSRYSYFATGVSLVLHPYSPFVPTIHANYRYFEIEDPSKNIVAWCFGGGTDLTPYYLFEEDAIHFHTTLKCACNKTDPFLYPKLKKEADDYFYLPHREEHRGIGGIFSLKMSDKPREVIYDWVRNCSDAFLTCYLPIVEKRMHEPFEEASKKWQLLRRGRYVEFNLMHDVGTQFGLKSGGNVENILMTMPPHVCWEYGFQPEPNSPEEKLLKVIKTPRDWA